MQEWYVEMRVPRNRSYLATLEAVFLPLANFHLNPPMFPSFEKARKTVPVIATLIILFWIGFFAVRWTRARRLPEQYQIGNRNQDENVGWVMAREAQRIRRPDASVVLFLPARENEHGSIPEQQSFSYIRGFQNGMNDDEGKPLGGIQILAKKYLTDEPIPPMHGWPPVSVLQDLARQYPQCNVMASFTDVPQVKPEDRGHFDTGQLPRVIALGRGIGSPADWKSAFETGVVEVLLSQKDPSFAAGQITKTPRERVELQYRIITRENLAETILQAGH